MGSPPMLKTMGIDEVAALARAPRGGAFPARRSPNNARWMMGERPKRGEAAPLVRYPAPGAAKRHRRASLSLAARRAATGASRQGL
jgi:hypothetical protein